MKRRTYYDAEPWYQRENTVDWYQQMPATNKKVKQILLEWITPESRIIETACGGGNMAEYIASLQPCTYYGFDYSETAVRHARKRLKAQTICRIDRGDALDRRYFEPCCYDILLSHQFLHCLVGDDRQLFLQNCQSALKGVQSKIILSSMHGVPPQLEIDPITRTNKPGNRYYAFDQEIKSELDVAGFKMVDVSYPEDYCLIITAKRKTV